MRRFLAACGAILALAMLAPTASAGEWMFKRSNYSYSPARGEEFGPNRFARGPYYSQPHGAVVRSGYRHLRGYPYGGWGYGWDNYHLFESWIQFGEQF
jgi:hypothetical protein